MTAYIFEDHENDGLSHLFRTLYPIEVQKQFIYARGCGRLDAKLTECLNNDDYTKVVIFMDAVPGNNNTWKKYNVLKRMAKHSSKQVHVIPLPCSEYYFIKAFHDTPINKMPSVTEACLGFKPFFDSEVVTTDEDKEYCKYFERYCKLVQKKAFYSCANTVGEHGRYFYLNDCNDAVSLLLREKAYKYIQAYPCIPKGAVQGPDADIDKIVYDLTTLHNRLCDILKEVDKEDRVYKYIYP